MGYSKKRGVGAWTQMGSLGCAVPPCWLAWAPHPLLPFCFCPGALWSVSPRSQGPAACHFLCLAFLIALSLGTRSHTGLARLQEGVQAGEKGAPPLSSPVLSLRSRDRALLGVRPTAAPQLRTSWRGVLPPPRVPRGPGAAAPTGHGLLSQEMISGSAPRLTVAAAQGRRARRGLREILVRVASMWVGWLSSEPTVLRNASLSGASPGSTGPGPACAGNR